MAGSVLKCLTMESIVSISGLCFMQNRKMITDKKNLVVEYLLFEDACNFVTFKNMLLAIGTNPISCLLLIVVQIFH